MELWDAIAKGEVGAEEMGMGMSVGKGRKSQDSGRSGRSEMRGLAEGEELVGEFEFFLISSPRVSYN